MIRVRMSHKCTYDSVVSTVLSAIEGRLTGAVFIDLRKAFDNVNHEVLLNKLRGLGVMDGEHECFRTAPNCRISGCV